MVEIFAVISYMPIHGAVDLCENPGGNCRLVVYS